MISYCKYCGREVLVESEFGANQKKVFCSGQHKNKYNDIMEDIEWQKRTDKTRTMNKTQLRLESKNWRKIQNFLLR